MQSEEKMEMIQQAIKQLMEDEKFNSRRSSSIENFESVDDVGGDGDDKLSGGCHRHHLLSELLSQIESLKGDAIPFQSKESANVEQTLSSEVGEKNQTADAVGSCSSEIRNEEIVKELKEVKKQNLITHCLLSAMIVITIAWQLSEVSLILKFKDALSHPLKFIGGLFLGMFKGSPDVNIQEAMTEISTKQKQKQILEPTSLPGLKIPGLPLADLPGSDSKEDDK